MQTDIMWPAVLSRTNISLISFVMDLLILVPLSFLHSCCCFITVLLSHSKFFLWCLKELNLLLRIFNPMHRPSLPKHQCCCGNRMIRTFIIRLTSDRSAVELCFRSLMIKNKQHPNQRLLCCISLLNICSPAGI
jgi:hypothetical protein